MAQTNPEDSKLDMRTRAGVRDVDRKLDDAIEDSMVASDPVAFSMPHDRVESTFARLEQVPASTWFLVGGGLLALIALIAFRR